MKDIMGLMKQAKKMQENMERAKQDVAALTTTGKSGGGLVTLTLSGSGNMSAMKIDPSLLNPDEGEVLEDLIIAAFHDAKAKMDEASQAAMKDAMGDIQLPPGMSL
ncbi:YbaB/EbfC family nucleoid-associated protein [Robiginitomaculum antarcticum]|uniref:YbaB/EbfC family nucleoid-associated protein n=1 Tax=Robiginitomaculum antarcticum TaxID=437507 RepID=UPI000377DE0E|nr:YbaB/EbfC family nucleoid-associated protein [Robiginitomaculum antarcticum]